MNNLIKEITRIAAFGYLAVVLSLVSPAAVNAQIKSSPDETSAGILTMDAAKPDPKIPIESVTGFEGRSSLVLNRAKTFSAFVLCVPSNKISNSCSSRVFVKKISSGATYVINGEDDGVTVMRPVDGLKWLNNDLLSYERWTTPHYGHRYVINVRLKKQVAAYILSDNLD